MKAAKTISRVLAAAGTLMLASTLFQTTAGAIASDTPCNEKCLADYVAAAEKCCEIKGEEERKKCNESLHERYSECRKGCKEKSDDKEKCKQRCDKYYEKCMDGCKDGDCRNKCFKEYQECLMDCEKG